VPKGEVGEEQTGIFVAWGHARFRFFVKIFLTEKEK